MLNQFSQDLTRVSRFLVGGFLSDVYGPGNRRDAELDVPGEFFVRKYERRCNGISHGAPSVKVHEGARKYTHTGVNHFQIRHDCFALFRVKISYSVVDFLVIKFPRFYVAVAYFSFFPFFFRNSKSGRDSKKPFRHFKTA